MTVRETIISPYTITFISSFLIGFTLAAKELKDSDADYKIVRYSALLNLVTTLYGALVLTYISSGFKSIGFSSMGGLAGIVIGSIIIDKIFNSGHLVLNSYLLQMPLMYSVSKLGCFLVGCCHGIEYSGPLSVQYVGTLEHLPDNTVFPVQIVETLIFLIIYVITMILHKKNVRNHILIMVCTSALAKGLLDNLRFREAEVSISVNQILCISVILLSVSIMIKRLICKNK